MRKRRGRRLSLLRILGFNSDAQNDGQLLCFTREVSFAIGEAVRRRRKHQLAHTGVPRNEVHVMVSAAP